MSRYLVKPPVGLLDRGEQREVGGTDWLTRLGQLKPSVGG